MKLFVGEECWKFRKEHPEEWKSFGCGPGKFGDKIVFDSILGVSIVEACRIHDWYYRFWIGENRKMIDDMFLNNMNILIERENSSGIMRKCRLFVALCYYKMVREFGSQAYYEERK